MRSYGLMLGLLLAGGCVNVREQSAMEPKSDGPVITATAWAKVGAGGDAYGAGRHAALSLKAKLDGVVPQVVVLTECFAEKADKAKAAKGVASVFGKKCVVGISAYGFYTRDGVVASDGVGLLALGGNGIAVRTAFVPKMKAKGLAQDSEELQAALGAAGRRIAEQFPMYDNQPRLMVVLADAHSPKNQLLVDGIQSAVGTKFPIAGGSANKNDGQNWIHWRGGLYEDAAVALLIEGNIAVAQDGAQAKDNDAVLATARDVASRLSASENLLSGGLFLAFDCTGRKGKLDDIEDEQKAVIEGLKNPNVKVFGMWCAGEIGCPEDSPQQPVGRGWHIMGTVIGSRRVPAENRLRPASALMETEP
ncbi:MAG: hypothetical protein FWG50_07680 [Kiritimatiellaeota bacterium]|nr:hypothetical protein [Kiritimatiellota bacterium]